MNNQTSFQGGQKKTPILIAGELSFEIFKNKKNKAEFRRALI
jgi:hypothetical protein